MRLLRLRNSLLLLLQRPLDTSHVVSVERRHVVVHLESEGTDLGEEVFVGDPDLAGDLIDAHLCSVIRCHPSPCSGDIVLRCLDCLRKSPADQLADSPRPEGEPLGETTAPSPTQASRPRPDRPSGRRDEDARKPPYLGNAVRSPRPAKSPSSQCERARSAARSRGRPRTCASGCGATCSIRGDLGAPAERPLPELGEISHVDPRSAGDVVDRRLDEILGGMHVRLS